MTPWLSENEKNIKTVYRLIHDEEIMFEIMSFLLTFYCVHISVRQLLAHLNQYEKKISVVGKVIRALLKLIKQLKPFYAGF